MPIPTNVIPPELVDRIQTLSVEELKQYISCEYSVKTAFVKNQNKQNLYVLYEYRIEGVASDHSLLLLKFGNEHLDLLLRYLVDRLKPSVSNEILESLMRIEAKIRNKDSENGQNSHKEDS